MSKTVTAAEVLTAVGVSPDAIGNTRVRIGGLRGINSPDHKIKIQDGVTELQVIVGEETYTYEA